MCTPSDSLHLESRSKSKSFSVSLLPIYPSSLAVRRIGEERSKLLILSMSLFSLKKCGDNCRRFLEMA